jgi:single-stranded DNA-binding protein
MEKKYYTFLNANKCVGSNGNEFVGVTTQVTVSNFKDKTVGDTALVSGRAPIANRSTILSTVLGKEIAADENGNVWVDVTFWGDRAERFKKYLNGREKVRIFLTGVLTCHEFTRADGSTGIGVGIKVTDWTTSEFRAKED